ncbi:hypothetical protein HDU67_001393 [Dinochytrium kinnereticum]|nr:hypothetical protein HDU67_001393 [Dinochytrium kinnereticum]
MPQPSDNHHNDLLLLNTAAASIDAKRLHAESLMRSRAALAHLHTAHSIAAHSLVSLAMQSERLDGIESSLSLVEGQVKVADEKAREIKRMQRLFVLPKSWRLFGRLKDMMKKKNAKTPHSSSSNDDGEETPTTPSSQPTSSLLTTAKRLTQSHQPSEDTLLPSPRDSTTKDLLVSLFEDAAEDQEDLQVEHEINQTLHGISHGLSLLKEASVAMGDEIEMQTRRITGLGDVGARAAEAVGAANRTLDQVVAGNGRSGNGKAGGGGGVKDVAGKMAVKAMVRSP